METTIYKDKLLSILLENRSKHCEVFEKALEGYRAAVLSVLEEHIKALSQGRSPQIRIIVDRPENHTRDYDRVIKMLELDVNDKFTLSESESAQYVMDDWQWKRQWLKMSNRYAADTTQEVYGVIEDDSL